MSHLNFNLAPKSNSPNQAFRFFFGVLFFEPHFRQVQSISTLSHLFCLCSWLSGNVIWSLFLIWTFRMTLIWLIIPTAGLEGCFQKISYGSRLLFLRHWFHERGFSLFTLLPYFQVVPIIFLHWSLEGTACWSELQNINFLLLFGGKGLNFVEQCWALLSHFPNFSNKLDVC